MGNGHEPETESTPMQDMHEMVAETKNELGMYKKDVDKMLLRLFHAAHTVMGSSEMWEYLSGGEEEYVKEVFLQEHEVKISDELAKQCFDAICADNDIDDYMTWIKINIK